ncbi:hypothetical protein ASPFODRAFT_46728 [Aspergillus luchuensis CBS 106.47]|uniref:Uncharacterized protein n=1 Tax=Aspergillus luchuensis (strain CBS 106.47) TaxID=1137211 RepID=A0A1M3TFZ6_ASPLC|nr:hypothetical protein ASPFODRAFT_46728 [Aspergillus luchuensis CBS 106.47]
MMDLDGTERVDDIHGSGKDVTQLPRPSSNRRDRVGWSTWSTGAIRKPQKARAVAVLWLSRR